MALPLIALLTPAAARYLASRAITASLGRLSAQRAVQYSLPLAGLAISNAELPLPAVSPTYYVPVPSVLAPPPTFISQLVPTYVDVSGWSTLLTAGHDQSIHSTVTYDPDWTGLSRLFGVPQAPSAAFDYANNANQTPILNAAFFTGSRYRVYQGLALFASNTFYHFDRILESPDATAPVILGSPPRYLTGVGVIPLPYPTSKYHPPLLVPDWQQPILGVAPYPVPIPWKDITKLRNFAPDLPTAPVFEQPSAPVYVAPKPNQVPLDDYKQYPPLPRSASPPMFHSLRPPRKNEKEGKIKMPRSMARVLSDVTETVDFINAIYEAVPENLRPRYKDTRFVWRNPPPQVKLEYIYNHWQHINGRKAFGNVLANHIEDMLIGKLSAGVRRNQKAIDRDRLFGYLSGPAL